MRITGGSMRGRKIEASEGPSIRPTSDRAREAIFNILAHKCWGEDAVPVLEGASVLDAFGGTGAMGIEAISWGAERAFFFDKAREACEVIRANVKALGLGEVCHVERGDATLPPPRNGEAFDLLFLDPPYDKGLAEAALTALDRKGWVAPEALVVIEQRKNEAEPHIEGFELLENRTYGEAGVWFLRKKAV